LMAIAKNLQWLIIEALSFGPGLLLSSNQIGWIFLFARAATSLPWPALDLHCRMSMKPSRMAAASHLLSALRWCLVSITLIYHLSQGYNVCSTYSTDNLI
jgi:hypothetical protein